MPDIKWPFGAADVTVTVYNNKTVLKLNTLTGNKTLNLDIDTELQIGAELIIEVTQGATGRDVVLGTGFQANAADLTGVSLDVDVMKFVYDGTSFVKISQTKVVDAA
jgi:hypothetical protein